MAETFASILETLAAGQPIGEVQQATLADLPFGQTAAFLAAWTRLSEPARLHVLAALDDLAATNLRLDFNPLYRAVLHDPAPAVRAAAIRTSREDETEQFLLALLNLLERDPSVEVRAAAAEALAPFAYRAEVGLLDEPAAARLQAVLAARAQDAREDAGVRAQALAGLGYFSAPEAQAVVQQALEHPALEQAAVRALGRSADPRYLERLLDYSQSPQAELRAEAATALGEIEDERAVPRLIELVDDASQEVRVAALCSLGQIGGEEAQEALLYAVEDLDPGVAEAAREALATLEASEELSEGPLL
ncbi:MAG: HEAT repeat domain-containing protein [Chloroflexi bacterium]|nr:HEAT repeat domain-containing protein [Chloroflexota bacterium]